MTIRRVDQTELNYTPRLTSKPEVKQEAVKETKQSEVKDQVSIGTKEEQQAAPKKWTIMHYSAADNNLTSYLVTDVNEMEKVGSTPNMNIVVQLDKGGSDCKKYYLEPDGDMKVINSPMLEDMGSVNMSDPKVLGDFISSTMKKYPAEHYALIISDHGGGWPGAVEDDSHGGWMTTPDIQKGVELGEKEGGKKLDVIGFDACLMANTEVGFELKDNAKFLVASEETEGANGWPYTPLLTPKTLQSVERSMHGKLNITPEEFAKKIVAEAHGDQGTLPTMSAMDLSKMDGVAKASDNLAKAILKTDTPNSTLKTIAQKTQNFSGMKDQFHFAEQIVKSETITDAKLKEAATGVMDAINTAVIAEQHSARYPNAHGLTAEIPSYGGVGSGYENLKFRGATNWAEAMNKIQDAGDPAPAPGPAKKKWTLLHYTAGDNNLVTYLNSDVNEMEKIGSNEHMNIVVQFDKGGTDCKRYYLEADSDSNKINSPVLQDMGKTNMADPKVLADFIKFGIKNYPAEHYALVIGDHGGGWTGAVEDAGSHGWMDTPTIQAGLQEAQDETGEKLDILAFDACLMANTEVSHELKGNATFMVASEEVEGGDGWPYTPLLTPKLLTNVTRALRSRLNIDPEEFAKKMITNAATDQGSLPTLSAMDMSKIDKLTADTDKFAEAIINTDTPNATLKALARKTQSFSANKDLYHFCELVVNSADVKDEGLKETAKGVMASIKDAVIAEEHSTRYPNAHGLTAEIPTYGGVGSGYNKLKFAQETRWDDAMNKMSK